ISCLRSTSASLGRPISARIEIASAEKPFDSAIRMFGSTNLDALEFDHHPVVPVAHDSLLQLLAGDPSGLMLGYQIACGRKRRAEYLGPAVLEGGEERIGSRSGAASHSFTRDSSSS